MYELEIFEMGDFITAALNGTMRIDSMIVIVSYGPARYVVIADDATSAFTVVALGSEDRMVPCNERIDYESDEGIALGNEIAERA